VTVLDCGIDDLLEVVEGQANQSGPLRPDPLQGFAELALAQRSSQVTLSQGASDPPGLKTAKDQSEEAYLELPRVQQIYNGMTIFQPSQTIYPPP
jgi:hypothetical protein